MVVESDMRFLKNQPIGNGGQAGNGYGDQIMIESAPKRDLRSLRS